MNQTKIIHVGHGYLFSDNKMPLHKYMNMYMYRAYTDRYIFTDGEADLNLRIYISDIRWCTRLRSTSID